MAVVVEGSIAEAMAVGEAEARLAVAVWVDLGLDAREDQ